MLNPSLYTRDKVPVAKEGRTQFLWRYHRVKEGRGVKTASLKGPFYARNKTDGRTVWTKLLNPAFTEAKLEAREKAGTIGVIPVTDATGSRITIRAAVDTYLEQKSSKARKTQMQYRTTLEQFIAALDGRVRFLDEITPDVLRLYKKYMVSEGYAGKTIDTRINIVNFLLKKNGIIARIPSDEMPVVQVEAAVPYSEQELKKLFAEMDELETLRYKFFLSTGGRDREVAFASWADINFEKKTYTIRAKPDAGFFPKNHESRTVPLPDSLIALLKKTQRNKTSDRWIFSNKDGKPENHSLRKLKRIALNAGLNCGHCKTTMNIGRYQPKVVEISCATHPVCEHIYLHRLRKTCATRWHDAGIPMRTLQHLLGHKNLETTMLYLGIQDSDELRGRINEAAGD